MHKKLRELFSEHAAPTHCDRQRTFAATKPLAAFAINLQRQIAEYRALMIEAETDSDFPDDLRGKIELMMQPLGALERMATDMMRLSREITNAMVQVERVFAEAKQTVEEKTNGASAEQ